MRPNILITEPEYFTQSSITMMKKVGKVKAKRMNRAELLRLISKIDVLVIRAETYVDKRLIDNASRLKCVVTATTGLDHIDTQILKERDIVLFSLTDEHSISTAEHAFALLLAAARNIPQAHMAMSQGKWQRWNYIGTELSGKTLGIFGLGCVGTALTRLIKGFDFKVLAYDPFLSTKEIAKRGAQKVSLNILLKNSDFISLHAPLTQKTKGIFNLAAFKAMKPSVIFINTSRGALVPEKALLKALKDRLIKAAAIDVYPEEPLPVRHPFRTYARQHNHLILTPHIGASTSEAIERASQQTAKSIFKFFSLQ